MYTYTALYSYTQEVRILLNGESKSRSKWRKRGDEIRFDLGFDVLKISQVFEILFHGPFQNVPALSAVFVFMTFWIIPILERSLFTLIFPDNPFSGHPPDQKRIQDLP